MAIRLLDNEAVLKDTALLTYLNSAQLLQYRLVSSTWRNVCTDLLIQRRSYTITFVHNETDDDDGQYESYANSSKFISTCATTSSSSSTTTKRPLQSLLKCLETSHQFPCVKFRFYDGNVAEKSLQNFLKMFGPQIKSLSFTLKTILDRKPTHQEKCCQIQIQIDNKNAISWSSLKVFKNILQEKVPNLEVVEIFSSHKEKASLPFVPLVPLHVDRAPFLSAVDQQSYYFSKVIYLNLIKTVLESSTTKLKSFPLTVYPFRDKEILGLLMRYRKFNLIEKLHVGTYDINNYFDEQLYSDLIAIKVLPVKRVDISIHSSTNHLNYFNNELESQFQNSKIISKILGLTSNYVQHIKLYCFPLLVPNFHWLPMPKVKKISFYLGNAQDQDHSKNLGNFKSDFNWSTIFPHLHSIQLETSMNYILDSEWETTFLNRNQLPAKTVMCLRINSFRPIQSLQKWLQIFSHLFPNLRYIELNLENLNGISAALQTFQKLNKIKLKVPICKNLKKLKAGLTSEGELWKQLIKSSADIFGGSKFLSGHEQSVLNLPDLKLLDLEFLGCDLGSIRVMSKSFKIKPDFCVKINYCPI